MDKSTIVVGMVIGPQARLPVALTPRPRSGSMEGIDGVAALKRVNDWIRLWHLFHISIFFF